MAGERTSRKAPEAQMSHAERHRGWRANVLMSRGCKATSIISIRSIGRSESLVIGAGNRALG
jgi:hypothetical protein